MKYQTLAKLVLQIKESATSEWVAIKNYDLQQPVIRIGRSTNCEIVLNLPEFRKIFQAISRCHATMFYYEGESLDFYIQDGQPGEITAENSNPEPVPSVLGVYINARNRRLELGEKYQLKHNDEFHLIFDRLKFIYLRENKVIDKLLEDTFIPEEYLL